MSGFHILPDPNKFRLEPGVVDEGPSIFYPKYGLLYNWCAATDAKNIAAAGWHVPIHTEYTTLRTYLGGVVIAGGKLKEIGFIYWDSPNTGATNEVGFNARGAGVRSSTGVFLSIKTIGDIWSATSYDDDVARKLSLSYNLEYSSPNITQYKEFGLPIRPIKDSTTLTHGQTGTYTGNDGKVYRTICIGTQEWLADNLAETKYRNGDDIPEVTDNAAWAALTTGALCAYNNDWNNV